MDNSKNTAGKQPRIFNANERKLLNTAASPWMTRGLALFWLSVAVSDYLRHRFSWIDGLIAAVWCIVALVEVVIIGMYRWKHRR